MSISVLVNGAFGRMGQMVCQSIAEHPRLELVGQTGREYDLKQAIKDSKAQVVVDFTHPDAVYANTRAILEVGARPVIGTTGLTSTQVMELQNLCAQLNLGGVIAPNFSLGAVLLMKYAQQIMKYMPNVEIIEMHHDGKADSPSGTAIRTAELLKTAHTPKKSNLEIREPIVAGARGANYCDIPIHAIRLPGLLAHEQVIFGSSGETLTLRHDSIDRICFMPGVCLACEKAVSLDRLVYGLEEIL